MPLFVHLSEHQKCPPLRPFYARLPSILPFTAIVSSRFFSNHLKSNYRPNCASRSGLSYEARNEPAYKFNNSARICEHLSVLCRYVDLLHCIFILAKRSCLYNGILEYSVKVLDSLKSRLFANNRVTQYRC